MNWRCGVTAHRQSSITHVGRRTCKPCPAAASETESFHNHLADHACTIQAPLPLDLLLLLLLAVLVFAVAQLAADGAGDGEAGVDVGEEVGGVLLDLADDEARAAVDAGGVDARDEGAVQAADAAADVGGALDGDRVREGNAVTEVSVPCVVCLAQ